MDDEADTAASDTGPSRHPSQPIGGLPQQVEQLDRQEEEMDVGVGVDKWVMGQSKGSRFATMGRLVK